MHAGCREHTFGAPRGTARVFHCGRGCGGGCCCCCCVHPARVTAAALGLEARVLRAPAPTSAQVSATISRWNEACFFRGAHQSAQSAAGRVASAASCPAHERANASVMSRTRDMCPPFTCICDGTVANEGRRVVDVSVAVPVVYAVTLWSHSQALMRWSNGEVCQDSCPKNVAPTGHSTAIDVCRS